MIRFFKKIWFWFTGLFGRSVVVMKRPVATRVVKPGQRLWECNLVTGEITEAVVVNGVCVVEENCIYEFALNAANAVRKFESKIVAEFGKTE